MTLFNNACVSHTLLITNANNIRIMCKLSGMEFSTLFFFNKVCVTCLYTD